MRRVYDGHMNSTQRRGLRLTLTERGFTRTSFTDDLSAVGDYTETWTHTDGTTVEVKWAPREAPAPVADPEDRTLTESRTAGWAGTAVPPEAFARFLNKSVRISCVQSNGTCEVREGVVADVWRLDHTSLGVRLDGTPEKQAGDNVIVLRDDAVWRVALTGVPEGTDEHWHPAHPVGGAM